MLSIHYHTTYLFLITKEALSEIKYSITLAISDLANLPAGICCLIDIIKYFVLLKTLFPFIPPGEIQYCPYPDFDKID